MTILRKRARLVAGLALLAVGIPAFSQKEAPLSYPGTAPDTPEAATLARDVVGRINKAYRTLLDTDAQGYDAVYGLTIDGDAAGAMAVTWSRERGTLEAKFRPVPGRPEANERSVRELEFIIADNIGEHTNHLVQGPGQRARRRGEWWILDDLSPSAEAKLIRWRLVTSADLAKVAISMTYTDGVRREIEYTGRRIGDGFVLASKFDRYPDSGLVYNAEFGYSLQEGRLLVQSLRIGQKRPDMPKESSIAVDLQSVAFR